MNRKSLRILYLALLLCLCSAMCLGFVARRHSGGEAGYYLRVNLASLRLREEKVKEPPLRRAFALPEEKGGWYFRETFPDKGSPAQLSPSSSFSGADGGPDDWDGSGGLLGISRGMVVLRGLPEDKPLSRMGELVLQAESSPLPLRDFSGIAEGRQSPEDLLAELDGSFFTLPASGGEPGQNGPNWGSGLYGAALFSAGLRPPRELFCFADRMETASWLNLLRLDTPGRFPEARRAGGRNSARPSLYLDHVEFFAGRYALPPSLVYGIMRAESSFNPAAVSPSNALGLMQVVPESAGGEVHAYLTGKRGSPEDHTLFKPASNIQYGTAYLHLLRKRHFKNVRNPVSRELCVIAAYNCGPSSLFRVFDRDRSRALEKINRLTPEELYGVLLKKLPSRESREYLPKVLSARNEFLRGTARF
ncbi:MAG: transglycosylase SLT domain-containing protein [Deltaproteobacteria bacterium]|nr:transglycosylase SLT domain-containing protein [Deltaproteobacteria bacterium]